jgi:pimeloyl-ACP methyl ester carboxylesterase
MPLAKAGEVELSYERTGSGPPLLMIMGMSGTFSHWGEPFLRPLRAEFETIVYDHRGVGASSRLDGPVTTAGMAQDALALLDALELETVHVLGISMGGMIAQELALAHPERVRTLTLGCTYCGGAGSMLSSAAVLQRLSEGMMSGDRDLAIRTAWEVNVSPRLADDPAAYARFHAIATERAVALPVIMAQMQACGAHDTSARLGALTMPTLVVHGSVDEMLPVQNGRLIHDHIAGSELEILDGVGHLYFWEQPEGSARRLIEHATVHA